MQEAYQEFMLGKSKSGVPTSPKEQNRGNIDNDWSSRKKSGYRPILRALQGRLEEWKDTNYKLEGVLRSIANLRDRVYWESGCLKASSVAIGGRTICVQQQQERKQQGSTWRDSGFRSISLNHIGGHTLLNEDIDLALNHDLLQHEKMLSALRSLVASLAQSVDEVGRRLDEWMFQNLMDQNDEIDEKMFGIIVKEQNTLEIVQEVYSLLASDLYLKQKMATRILDSCHDGLLGIGDENNQSRCYRKVNPRDVIRKTAKELSSTEQKTLIRNLVGKLLIIQ